MNAEPVITIEGVSKRFKRFRRRRDRFLELIRHRQLHTDFIALEPLSLTVRKGTILGIIG